VQCSSYKIIMDDYARLRKNEYLLAISGAGVIAFGLWSVIKAVIYLLVLSPKQLVSAIDSNEVTALEAAGISDNSIGIGIICVIVFVLLVDLLLRFYVGRSAIIDGRRQKKKSIVYVVMAILLSIGLISSTITRLAPTEPDEFSTVSNVMDSASASIFIDLTSLLAFVEMIIAAITVRRLRKKLGENRTEVM